MRSIASWRRANPSNNLMPVRRIPKKCPRALATQLTEKPVSRYAFSHLSQTANEIVVDFGAGQCVGVFAAADVDPAGREHIEGAGRVGVLGVDAVHHRRQLKAEAHK